jgi:hypothetical protein
MLLKCLTGYTDDVMMVDMKKRIAYVFNNKNKGDEELVLVI